MLAHNTARLTKSPNLKGRANLLEMSFIDSSCPDLTNVLPHTGTAGGVRTFQVKRTCSQYAAVQYKYVFS